MFFTATISYFWGWDKDICQEQAYFFQVGRKQKRPGTEA